MESLDYWRFCSALTVVQAALLIVGEDPTPHLSYISDWKPEEQPAGYPAVLIALKNDILSGQLTAQQERIALAFGDMSDDTDWDRTRVFVTDLKGWLSERGVSTGFFFPRGLVTAEYLDAYNECYAPKLAAAVEAWRSVRIERQNKPSPRSVKQDLTRWLNLHAARFGLANDEGEPSKQAVDEVAKVANWDTKGGAPRTPQGD